MSNSDLQEAGQASRLSGKNRFVLAALVFSGVMLAGAWQIVDASWHTSLSDLPHTWSDFREGRTTGALEKQLDQKMPARESFIALANSLRYTLTGGAGEQVRAGKDGWLFLTDEIRFHENAKINLLARADLLAAAAGALQREDVKLVVVLVPDKARVYPNHLAAGRLPEHTRFRYQDALAALRQRGVSTVDVLAALASGGVEQEVYYRSDTHWNQTGARIVAQAVAAAILPLGLVLDPITFTTEKNGVETERAGDLIRLMGLHNMPNLLRPRPDREIPLTTRQTSAVADGGLFGDASVPVVLTGTSYSLRGNFHGFLQQALSAKVLNTAKDGGGFLQAPTQYLTDEAFRSAKPRVLIWEVPERFLAAKLDGEATWLDQVNLRR